MRISIMLVAVGLLSGVLLADTVFLHDGRSFEGEVISPPNAPTVQIRTPMGTVQFRASEVREVRYGKAVPSEPTPTTPRPVDPAAVEADPAVRAKFAAAGQMADRATTGAEGLMVWQQFLREHPTGTLAELARQRMEVWKDRADRDQVKFGPAWIARAEADARNARANELLKQADAALTITSALRLIGEAAQQHPYRADIPLKKGMLHHKDGAMKEFAQAMGEAMNIDPENVVARNNVAVLQARQRQWTTAASNFARAALASIGDERVLDNLDQLCVMVAASGASLAAVSECERTLQQVIVQLQMTDRHKGKIRWGDRWITAQEHQRFQQENLQLDREAAPIKAKIESYRPQYAKLTARRDELQTELRNSFTVRFRRRGGGVITLPDHVSQQVAADELRKVNQAINDMETEVNKLRDEVSKLEAKRHVPAHTGTLILLTADGTGELEVIPVGPGQGG